MQSRYLKILGLAVIGLGVVRCEKKSSSSADDSAPVSNQSVEVSAFEGAGVAIAPGTIVTSPDNHFFAESAAALSEQGVMADLPLEGDTEIVSSSQALLVLPTHDVQVLQPFTISLPIGSEAGLTLVDLDPAKVVVIYKTVVGAAYTSGLLPASALTITGGTVSFSTSAFGAYQVVQLNHVYEQAITAESALKFIQDASHENLADKDGLGKPLISLKPLERKFPLEPSAAYRHFVNAAAVSAFPLAGRCTDPGATIVISGSMTASATCDDYKWAAGTVDMSALAEGELTISLAMNAGTARSDQEDFTLLKDVAPPTLMLTSSDLTITGSNVTAHFTTSSDIENLAWRQVSGPGILVISLHGRSAAAFELRVRATEAGSYVMAADVYDLAENNATTSAIITSTTAATVVEAKTPLSFSVENTAGQTTTTFGVSPNGVDHNDAGFGGYLIVRRVGTAVTWTPTNGTSYNQGTFADSDHKIIVIGGSERGPLDSDLTYGQTYYYKVFFFNVNYDYSGGVGDSVAIQTLTNSQVGAAGGYYVDLAVANNRLYAAKYARGLDVFDIDGANADAPVLMGSVDLAGDVTHVSVNSNLAFVIEDRNATYYMTVIDVSAPATPTVVSSMNFGLYDSYYGIFASGNYVYLSTFSKLYIIDVSTANAPVKVHEISGVSMAGRMLLDGNDLYVAASGAVHKIDVTNKTMPILTPSHSNANYRFYGLAKSGNDLYAGLVSSGSDGVAKIDVNNMSASAAEYSPVDANFEAGSGVDVILKGNSLIFTEGQFGIYTATTAPSNQIGPVATGGSTMAIALNGEKLYVAKRDSGLLVFDASGATPSLSLIKTIPTLSNSEDVVVVGNYAFIADAWNGLMIYDITSKTAPIFQGQFKVSNGYAYNVAVSGNTAYVAFGDGGVYALDVTDKTAPVELVKDATVDHVKHVSEAGTHVILSISNGSGGGLYVKDKATQTTTGSLSGFSLNRTVYDGNRYAYGISGSSGEDRLRVFDLQNPTSPVAVANIGLTETNATGIAYRSGKVYIVNDDAVGGHRLKVFDVTTPSTPTIVVSMILDHAPTAVQISGDFAYIAQGLSGVAMVNIADLLHPFAYGTMQVSYGALGLAISGDHVFVADGHDGLTIHERVD